MTLKEFVTKHGPLHVSLVTKTHCWPPSVGRIKKTRRSTLQPGCENQTNNLEIGAHVLDLSNKGLKDLDGIETLKVQVGDQELKLSQVKNLHLFANCNAISEVPAGLMDMQNVIFIYCYHNQIKTLPQGMKNMKLLQGIYFTGNRLTTFPSVVFEMPSLRKVQLSQNSIRVLPNSLDRLKGLIHFNLCSNQIAEIPGSIKELKNLRVCDLSRNPFASLPDSFGEVRIKYQLRIRHCHNVTTLPDGFDQLPENATIDITGTGINKAMLSEKLRSKVIVNDDEKFEGICCPSTHEQSEE